MQLGVGGYLVFFFGPVSPLALHAWCVSIRHQQPNIVS